jgi:predicted RNase H-like HicB family nuclease
MALTIEIIPDPEQGGYMARLPNIPAYGEGETENEAIDDLKEAIRGYIDAFGLEDALSRVAQPALRTIELDLMDLAHG